MQSRADNVGHRALLLLDVMKPFNSVEWTYLWEVLSKFGFDEGYISWVLLLYSHPQAAIRASGRMSHTFHLGRGMRQ